MVEEKNDLTEGTEELDPRAVVRAVVCNDWLLFDILDAMADERGDHDASMSWISTVQVWEEGRG